MNNLRDYYQDDQILQFLKYSPNKNIIWEQLGLSSEREFEYFYWGNGTELNSSELWRIGRESIYKVNIISDLRVTNESSGLKEVIFIDFQIECYISIHEDESQYNEPLVMSLNELLFHLNQTENIKVKAANDISALYSLNNTTSFNFIDKGRLIRNQYFDFYEGPALDLYFQDELEELFAVASNSLAFLLRYKKRVFDELEVIQNLYYHSRLNIFPRFNNAIAETAGTIYNFIERIAFFLNEFYPINGARPNVPSFGSYFRYIEKNVHNDLRLVNEHYEWFMTRLNGPHKRLSELRHPTVHYNKTAKVSGMRSAAMIQQQFSGLNPKELKDVWSEEIDVLTIELKELDRYLENTIGLIEKWASDGLELRAN